MPYSSDPGLYPPEMMTLIGLLERIEGDTLVIEVDSRAKALTKKTQIQAFFAAVGKHATKYRALATRADDKKLKAAQLAAPTKDQTAPPMARQKAIREVEEDSQDANAIARTWEDRFDTVSGWMVRTAEREGKWFVEISRRTLGEFGVAMLAAAEAMLPKRPAVGDGSPSALHTVGPMTNGDSSPIVRPRIDSPAGTAMVRLPISHGLVVEGSQPATDTTLEAQLAMLRQAAATLPSKN